MAKDVAKDVYLSARTLEQEEELIDKDVKTAAAQANVELKVAKQRLEEAEKQLATYEMLRKKWVSGDFSDLGPEHPFEILIHNDGDIHRNWPVRVCINGDHWNILRGSPTKVPQKVIEVLSRCTIDNWQPIFFPDGRAVQQRIVQPRFLYNARPLYE